MHPAFSVIFFTTASGAGYGLLALLAIFTLSGLLPATTWLGFVAMAISLGLIGAGLLSSMLHLGHPERFLRALTQWRSSWLAREGVLAIATFVPTGLFGIGWVFLNSTSGMFAWMAALSAVMAAVTVFFTSMIYASLKPIRQWHNGFVPPAYIVLGTMTGALLLVFLARLFGVYSPVFGILGIALLMTGWVLKTAYWRHIDTAPARSTLGTATGLGRLGGDVRLLEMPHTEENFLMREMGYQIARKHASKLRFLVHLLLFAAPLALTTLTFWSAVPPLAAGAASFGAVVLAGLGVATERWLFFAEATHTSMLYYGRTM
ncbi:MAG: dimethyl sulfoxide reductase anchor subunit [Notoacmeibacter sp.]|nr:dimethyl sulfoxide reductase anchor subunit [Notoacmeibacter sp.]